MTPVLAGVVEQGVELLKVEGEMSFQYLIERLKTRYAERGERLPAQRGLRAALIESGRVVEHVGYPYMLEAVSC